jgi:putative PIN family toxin of toxin-antitoxin system
LGKERILIRVVIDTNVLISSILFKGEASKLVDLWQRRRFVLLVSKPILEEYIKVLSYSKFSLSEEEIKTIIEEIFPYVEIVKFTKRINIIKDDPQDDIFLSTALE